MSQTDVAFLFEYNLLAVYEITPYWTVRTGIVGIVVDGVGLATENFNTNAPFVNPVPTQTINHGTVFYQGFTVGLEWNH